MNQLANHLASQRAADLLIVTIAVVALVAAVAVVAADLATFPCDNLDALRYSNWARTSDR